MFYINEKTLSSKERKKLDNSDFGIPEEKKYPMPDAEHVRKAIAFFKYASSAKKSKLAKKILSKASKFGIEIGKESELYKFLYESKSLGYLSLLESFSFQEDSTVDSKTLSLMENSLKKSGIDPQMIKKIVQNELKKTSKAGKNVISLIPEVSERVIKKIHSISTLKKLSHGVTFSIVSFAISFLVVTVISGIMIIAFPESSVLMIATVIEISLEAINVFFRSMAVKLGIVNEYLFIDAFFTVFLYFNKLPKLATIEMIRYLINAIQSKLFQYLEAEDPKWKDMAEAVLSVISIVFKVILTEKYFMEFTTAIKVNKSVIFGEKTRT